MTDAHGGIGPELRKKREERGAFGAVAAAFMQDYAKDHMFRKQLVPMRRSSSRPRQRRLIEGDAQFRAAVYRAAGACRPCAFSNSFLSAYF
jgi:hypothetical protein